jgi:predicted amidohydrolase YtcJ
MTRIQVPTLPADTLIVHADVWTGDSACPAAGSVAISGDRIVAVGAEADVRAWAGPKTMVIDAGQGRLVPGFNDSHVHFCTGGRQLDNVDLRTAPTPAEFSRRIAGRATARPGEWVTGGDWDEQQWAPAQLPTRGLVDDVTPDTPVAVNRYDEHMLLANSVALALAGITAATPDPAGGTIVRDAAGTPTGVLKDAAMSLVARVIPPLSEGRRRRALERAVRHAASVGVTSVRDMGPEPADLALYGALAEEGALSVRVAAAPPLASWQEQARLGIRPRTGTAFFTLGAVKGFSDGSLGSSTAYFFDPYLDDPSTCGLLAQEMIPLESMRDRLIAADGAGLQLCVHAIGDRAVSMVLDLYADVERTNGRRDRRWRIEHAQHVRCQDLARFAAMHVIAAVQPYHAIDDGRWAERRIGAARLGTMFAFRSLLDAGATLALGTDWPVAPLNPLLTIHAAVTRATLDGLHPGGWIPEQRMAVDEAVRAYSWGSAYAEGQEEQKGRIAAGMLADMVLLTDDIFAIEPRRIQDVSVAWTMVGGQIVFGAPAAGQ